MHSRLDTYLTEVSAQIGPLPAKARADELREMRAHLEAAFATGLAQGQSGDVAAQAVLDQFGPPGTVGEETVAAWRRGVTLDRRGFWGAAACALALLSFLPRLLDPFLYPTIMAYFQHIEPTRPALWWVLASLQAGCFVASDMVSLLMGALVGVFFPRRAVAAVGLALGAHLAWGLTFQVFHLSHARAWFAFPLACTPQQAVFTGLEVSLVLLGAWAGSRWQTARVRPMRVVRD